MFLPTSRITVHILTWLRFTQWIKFFWWSFIFLNSPSLYNSIPRKALYFLIFLSAGFQVPPDYSVFLGISSPQRMNALSFAQRMSLWSLPWYTVFLSSHFMSLTLIPLSVPRPSHICPHLPPLLELIYPLTPEESPPSWWHRHHVHFQVSLFSPRKASAYLKSTVFLSHSE